VGASLGPRAGAYGFEGLMTIASKERRQHFVHTSLFIPYTFHQLRCVAAQD